MANEEITTLTEKYQATIPKGVRQKLGLSRGDKIVFEIIEDKIWIRKWMATDFSYLSSLAGTLSEWTSEEDDKAYRDF